MKKVTLFLLSMMVVPGSVLSASRPTRVELDTQMQAAKVMLDKLNAQKATELQRLADAENSFKGRRGKSSLTKEDLETIRTITAQTVGEFDSQIATVKGSIKALAGHIKALKSAAQSAPSVAGAESEGRGMVSMEPMVQEFQETVSPVRETRLQELTRTSREKMTWITTNRTRMAAELDELKKLSDRRKANAGMLPEDSLTRLRDLQRAESKNRKVLKDLVEHEEGLIAFLTGKGLLHVLSDSPRVSPGKHQLDADEADKPEQSPSKREKKVTWRASLAHVAEIANNDDQGGVNLAAAAVDRDAGVITRARRNTVVGQAVPTMDARGVITVQRGLVTVQSAPENDDE